jgi:hypothetical protein
MLLFAVIPQSDKIHVRIEVRRQPDLDRASGRFPGFKKDEFTSVANDGHYLPSGIFSAPSAPFFIASRASQIAGCE